jgi:6-phosphogluconolactonase (cycloisomerase 2 family)
MSNAASGNAILAYKRAADGSLSREASYTTGGKGSGAALGSAGSVVLSQDKHWLFAVNAGSNEISVFAVDHDGALYLTSKTASGGSDPVSITADDDLVYVVNSGSDLIAGFRLTDDGKLVSLPGSVKGLGSTGTGPGEISFTPDGQELIVTEKNKNSFAIFPINKEGLPEGAARIEPSAGVEPFGFAFSNAKTLLVTEADGGAANVSSVSSYHLYRGGLLGLVDGSATTHQTAACWISATPDGRYAYSSNTGSKSISGFSVTPAGELTLLNSTGISGATGGAAASSVISPDGKFLYVLNDGGVTISSFAIADDGSLTSGKTVAGLPASADGLAIR